MKRKEWKRKRPPQCHMAIKPRYRGWMEKTWGGRHREDARKMLGRRRQKRGTRMVVPVEPLLIGPTPLYLSDLSAMTGTTHDITVC